jgi:hypothetical protein
MLGHPPPHVLRPADGTDVTDQPIRMHVRGQTSAVEYAKKSFSLDPVDQITDFNASDTTDIPFLGTNALPRAGRLYFFFGSICYT